MIIASRRVQSAPDGPDQPQAAASLAPEDLRERRRGAAPAQIIYELKPTISFRRARRHGRIYPRHEQRQQPGARVPVWFSKCSSTANGGREPGHAHSRKSPGVSTSPSHLAAAGSASSPPTRAMVIVRIWPIGLTPDSRSKSHFTWVGRDGRRALSNRLLSNGTATRIAAKQRRLIAAGPAEQLERSQPHRPGVLERG